MMMIFSNRLLLLIFISVIYFKSANADEIFVNGDNKTLINVDSSYNIHLKSRNFPLSYHFKYIFNIPELNIHDEIFIFSTNIDWRWNFTKTGNYQLNIQVFLYPFYNMIYGWKIAETNVPLEIDDNLDNLISIDAKQNVSSLTTDYVFAINKTIGFSLNIDPQSILTRFADRISYEWNVEGPGVNKTKIPQKTFDFVFESLNEYSISLQISTTFPHNQMNFSGKTVKKIQIKNPITDVSISGNNFVENGSLLHLNITCNGSSNFLLCHDFAPIKSNDSCFESGRVLSNCDYQITHYFPENGTKYVNIGIRNDVSTVYRNVKITIYKIGPKPSFAFVIIPLISLLLIIVIVVVGITHFIGQRRRINATIEVATIDNFAIYNDANLGDDDMQTLMGEKTFCRRVKDSFIETLCPK